MTREEAKRIAMGLRTDFKCESDTMVDFFDTIIKALEQEPCEDAVSRQAAIDAMYSICGDGTLKENEWRDNPHIDSIIDALNELPSVSTEKIGHWVKSKDGYMRCDYCGSRGSAIKARFCHHCGAKMEVEE